jgi:hypothetical protein
LRANGRQVQVFEGYLLNLAGKFKILPVKYDLKVNLIKFEGKKN